MSEPTAAAHAEPSRHVGFWAESTAQALGQISGVPVPCVALNQAADMPPAAATDLWMLCAWSGALRGEMSLRLPAPTVLRLAQIFMSEPLAPDVELTPDHREAALELVRQVAGLVTTAVRASWGEVQLHVESSAGAPSWSASSTTGLRIGEEASSPTIIEVCLSAALVAALRSEKTNVAKPSLEPSVSAPGSLNPPLSAEESKVKLDLLMDVELALTLRFGSRRLLLREVLDLNPGVVVDLDRHVRDPVDVLLDGRLLARGEVVVIDGNYGLRITEVGPAASL